jgi:hypothetical protein
MKRQLKKAFLLTTLTALFFTSCQKNDNSSEAEKIIFEKEKTEISGKFFDNHIKQVMQIGFEHSDLKMFKKSKEWNDLQTSGISNEDFDTENIRKFTYDNHNKILFELPLKSYINKSLVILQKGKQFMFVIGELKSTENELLTFSISSIKGELINVIKLNAEHSILGFESYKPLKWDNASFTTNNVELEPVDDIGGKTCPEKTSNYSDCMTCAINECASSFPCNATCMVWPISCLTGFTLACTL